MHLHYTYWPNTHKKRALPFKHTKQMPDACMYCPCIVLPKKHTRHPPPAPRFCPWAAASTKRTQVPWVRQKTRRNPKDVRVTWIISNLGDLKANYQGNAGVTGPAWQAGES